MKKLSFLSLLIVFMLGASNVFSQDLLGIWQTIDDKTGDPKSHVEIYKKGDKYFGKVVKLLPAATTKVCVDCPGDNRARFLEASDCDFGPKAQWFCQPGLKRSGGPGECT